MQRTRQDGLEEYLRDARQALPGRGRLFTQKDGLHSKAEIQWTFAPSSGYILYHDYDLPLEQATKTVATMFLPSDDVDEVQYRPTGDRRR